MSGITNVVVEAIDQFQKMEVWRMMLISMADADVRDFLCVLRMPDLRIRSPILAVAKIKELRATYGFGAA